MAENISSVGPSKDYSTLSAFEAGEDGTDWVSAGDQPVAECYNMDDTTAVTFDGWTLSASSFLTIRIASGEEHSGVWTTSTYRRTTTAQNNITCAEEFIRFEGLQLYNNYGGNDGRCIYFTATATGETYVEKCIFKDVGDASARTYTLLWGSGSQRGEVRIANNLFYQGSLDGGAYISVNTQATEDWWIYNNTFIDGILGISREDGTLIAINNLFSNQSSAPCNGTFAAGTDYNATDDSSMGYSVTGGGNTNDRVSQTFTFEAAGSDNYALASGDTGAKDYGTDLSSDTDYPIAIDIAGTDRTGTWDIGAFELAGASGSIDGTTTVTFDSTGSDLNASGSLSGSDTIAFNSTGSDLNASGSLSGSATIAFDETGSDLNASGGLSGTATVTFDETGSTLSSSGSLSGTATVTFDETGSTLSSGGGLSGSTTVTFDETGSVLNASGSLSGTITVTFDETGSNLSSAGSGAMSGSTGLTLSNDGALAGSGALTGSGDINTTGTSSLTAKGSLSGSDTLVFTCEASGLAKGYISGSENIDITGVSTLSGSGSLSGSDTVQLSGSATVSATVGITGNDTITLSCSGTLVPPATVITSDFEIIVPADTEVVVPADTEILVYY